MKVKDLIEQLGAMDQDADVHFAYNYGDYWRTQVAPCVESVFEGIVEYSEYHSMDKLADEEACYDEETGNYKEGMRVAVIIG